MKPGAVACGGDMIERPLCHAPIRVELPCRLQNCRPATVDHPIGALGIPAIEVDAQPTTYPRPVGRDVQPGACGAGHLRLQVDLSTFGGWLVARRGTVDLNPRPIPLKLLNGNADKKQ